MILRIGVGDTVAKQDGYLNVDIRPLPNINVVADAMKLPFKKGEIDGIETRNLVEHFSRFEIEPLFKEWARVLKKGGSLIIETIDMEETMDFWREIPLDALMDAVLGAQTYPENFHKMFFNEAIFRETLKDFEIKQVIRTNYRLIPRITVLAVKK